MMFDAVGTGTCSFRLFLEPAQQTPNRPQLLPPLPLLERGARVLTGLPIKQDRRGVEHPLQAGAAAILALIAAGCGASEREALTWSRCSSSALQSSSTSWATTARVLRAVLRAHLLAQRGQPWLVALALGFASAANPLGSPSPRIHDLGDNRSRLHELVHPAFVASTRSQGLVSVSGVIGYGLYLQVAFGNPLVFYQATKGWSVPVPIGTLVARVVTFEPLRASVTLWAASPYGSQVNFLSTPSPLSPSLLSSSPSSQLATPFTTLASGSSSSPSCYSRHSRLAGPRSARPHPRPVAFGAGAVAPVRRR